MSDIFDYETTGTCCKLMRIEVEDDCIKDANFYGGCNGNLQGIRKLIKGRKIDEIIETLEGTLCGNKTTSCPDQLAQALKLYKSKKQEQQKQTV